MFGKLFNSNQGTSKKPVPAQKARSSQPTPARPAAQSPRGGVPEARAAQSRRPVEDDLDEVPARAPGINQRPASAPVQRAPQGAPAREPTAEELDAILNHGGHVLTAEGGQIQIGQQQRAVIAALDNGTLLVSKSSAAGSAVQSVRLLLSKASYKVSQIYLVDLEAIRKVYENDARKHGTVDANRATAVMQRAVIDLVRSASQQRCSDIHITVSRHEALIRVRSDGVMMKLKDLSAATATDLCQAAFNMADASDASYKPFDYQGARISSLKSSLPEGVQAVRLQFNPLPDGGRYLVMRLLYNQKVSGPQDVDHLGYSAHQVRQLKRMRDKPFGIVVISGPTGSGKSTTLQTALQATAQMKNFEVNIITVEDPPEYEIRGAAQLPVVNAKTDEERREAFRAAITASLRSDPDIVMIGEIRDEASARLAFEAAMTGHQVYASLHANDAISILDRLRDQKVEKYKLSDPSLVAGLIGQRLVRRLCDHCKLTFKQAIERHILGDEMVETVEALLGRDYAHKHVHAANSDGCEHCRRGYVGRTVVAETILPDRKFMELIGDDKKHEAYEYWLTSLDGMTMLEHAVLKMASGEVDPREVGDKVGLFDEAKPARIERLMQVTAELAAAAPLPRITKAPAAHAVAAEA